MAKKTSPKEQGNREERKQAKKLGIWIFDDPKFLRKTEGSGSTHIIWTGDIAPIKELPEIWNKQWLFEIECKNGYLKHEPNFWKYEQMSKWVKKSYKESKIHGQRIIWLINQFPRKTALLSTNHLLQQLPFKVCWPVETEDGFIYMYTYRLKDVMEFNFYDLYNIEELTNDR